MWSGGDDVNEQGEAVRLYQPIIYGRKPNLDDLACSFIGGDSTLEEPCPVCEQPLQSLVQLHIPHSSNQTSSRTLQVFACNRASCLQSLFNDTDDGKLSYGGGGVVQCRRLLVSGDQTTRKVDEKEVDATSSATDNENDWTVDTGSSDIDDLEAKLAAIETTKTATPKAKQQSVTKKSRTKSSLPCYELSALQEPGGRRTEGMDEDDVGLTGGDKDDKIQQMLARYMAEEEDEEILSALKGASSGGGSGGTGGGRGERDERLSAEDRALLTFSDRLKRSPRQVLRYAYGGIPLWSIPLTSRKEQQRNAKQSKKKSKPKPVTVEKPIPPCICGAPRVFEMQVLPSILHVLEVDKYAAGGGGRTGLDAAYAEGGMDFGNIAIYSCLEACGSATEEYIVVQDSIDDRPTQPRQISDEPVVIQEGTTFGENDDNDDGNSDGDDEEMEDEEDC